MTTKSSMDLVNDAKRQIENLSPDDVQREMAAGNVTLIDLRESEELQENGKIEGSIHAPRGLLEFYADPARPVYKPEFARNNRLILYCSRGLRSALAAVTLQEMGYTNVAHLEGGFEGLKEGGKLVVE
jgi:rhodanese-related sulfurtransferase